MAICKCVQCGRNMSIPIESRKKKERFRGLPWRLDGKICLECMEIMIQGIRAYDPSLAEWVSGGKS